MQLRRAPDKQCPDIRSGQVSLSRERAFSVAAITTFIAQFPQSADKRIILFYDTARTGALEAQQPVIPLLLNTAINLARPIPLPEEYPSNPPPIPPPPEKYYASTEICNKVKTRYRHAISAYERILSSVLSRNKSPGLQ